MNSEIDYKKLFKLCLEHADNLLLVLNENLSIKTINPLAEKILGWKKKEVCNKKISDIFQEKSFPPFIKRIFPVKADKAISYIEKENQKIKIIWTITPLKKKERESALVFIIGSIEPEISSEQLELLQLRNVVKYAPGLLYWKDVNSVYHGCNDEFARLAGLESSAQVKGKTDFNLIWKDRAELYVEVDKNVVESGLAKLNHVEAISISSNKIITAITNKVPMLDNNGQIIGVLGITTDITHQKEIEQSLCIAKETAEAANRAKDEFLANISHDLRTPLTGIIGISAMLEQEVQTIEEKEHAHWVNVSGEQLLTLLNSVLDIVSTGDRQENHVKIEVVNINQLLHNIAELELPTIKLKHLELTIDVDNSVPDFIKTDPVKLHRVLLNLLGNAIKFTDIGHIALRVEYSCFNDKKGQLELFVSDTGPGIAKEDQGKVFDRFYRTKASYKGQYTGFGVGLHIVQQYVSMLKGSVSLESQVGKGTTFKVSIPVEIAANHPKIKSQTLPIHHAYNFVNDNIPVPAVTNATGNSPLLLLVEDNAIALKVVEAVVKQAHCQYLSATTGEQALELAQAHEFDLILSDIGLPGISGNELATSIRSLEKNLDKKPIPIIGVTAHAANDAEQESLQAGMNKVVSKPLNLATLQEIINHFVSPVQKQAPSKNSIFAKDLPGTEAELFNIDQFPLIDVDAGLKTLGTLETLKELLVLMLRDLPKDLDAITKAHTEKNWDLVEQTAHKMKSSALYCGVTRMKYACQYLERYQKSGLSHLQNELYQQLMIVVEQTQGAISKWLNSPP